MNKKNILFVVMIVISSLNVFGGLTDGLYNYMSFDGNLVSSLSTGINGTGLNVNYVTGKLGTNALKFNNSGQAYVKFTSSPKLATQSYAFWFLPTELRSSQYASDQIFCYASSGYQGWNFLISEATADSATFTHGTGSSNYNLNTPNSNFINNTWQHVIIQENGTTRQIYINGQKKIDSNGTFSLSTGQSLSALVLGWDTNSAGCGNDVQGGYFDEIAFYNRTLNQSEIDTLYNSGTGLAYPFNVLPAPLNFTYTKTCYFNGTGLSLNLMSGCY
jgi:hypothetical protein